MISWKKESKDASLKGSFVSFIVVGLAGRDVNVSGVPEGMLEIVVPAAWFKKSSSPVGGPPEKGSNTGSLD